MFASMRSTRLDCCHGFSQFVIRPGCTQFFRTSSLLDVSNFQTRCTSSCISCTCNVAHSLCQNFSNIFRRLATCFVGCFKNTKKSSLSPRCRISKSRTRWKARVHSIAWNWKAELFYKTTIIIPLAGSKKFRIVGLDKILSLFHWIINF